MASRKIRSAFSRSSGSTWPVLSIAEPPCAALPLAGTMLLASAVLRMSASSPTIAACLALPGAAPCWMANL
jgi:hypothetical protein